MYVFCMCAVSRRTSGQQLDCGLLKKNSVRDDLPHACTHTHTHFNITLVLLTLLCDSNTPTHTHTHTHTPTHTPTHTHTHTHCGIMRGFTTELGVGQCVINRTEPAKVLSLSH